mgnify:FL=1
MPKPIAILTFPSTLNFEEKTAMEKANKALAKDGYLVVELPAGADLQFYEPQRQPEQPVSVQGVTPRHASKSDQPMHDMLEALRERTKHSGAR